VLALRNGSRACTPRAVASDTANDDTLNRDAVQLAQADGGGDGAGQSQDRSVHVEIDFETFKRELEKEREREATERAAGSSGGQGAAPPTEPAPDSPEYQAADAEARRIVAEQKAKQGLSPGADAHDQPAAPSAAPSASPTPPTSPRTASVAALPAAGDAGGLGQAAWEAIKGMGAASARALPWLARGAGATAAAGTILLMPSNTGSTLQEIGNGLRLRINPDERAVRLERRHGLETRRARQEVL